MFFISFSELKFISIHKMQIINVKTKHEASLKCIQLIINYLNTKDNKLNIAFTGGRFSKFFLSQLTDPFFFKNRFRIFQTDERFVPTNHPESIQGMIMNSLKNQNNLDYCFFDVRLKPEDCAKDMEKRIDSLGLIGFDISILSLGEDGHLAGNFSNSINLGKNITYNMDAPKFPKERISFSIEWLVKSDLIILLAIGKDKHNAFQQLISGGRKFTQLEEVSSKIIAIRG